VRQHFWSSGKIAERTICVAAQRAQAATVATPGAGAAAIADTRMLSVPDKIQLLRKIGIKDSFDR
jgi:hypothetical protein